MNDFQFVVALGNTETDALALIPAPAIKRRMIDPGFYIIIRDQVGRRRGYILHGPPRAGKPLHIYQTCVEIDYRLRGYAAAAITTLALRATVANCTEIHLRCAQDLDAIDFWQALGFTFRQWQVGGNQRKRLIAELYLPLAPVPSRLLLAHSAVLWT
jgi:hypothetical protein